MEDSSPNEDDVKKRDVQPMGAGTGWAGWASAHPENNLGGHCPP